MLEIRRTITHSLRALRSRPSFTLVAVATLALGIGANTAIFSVIHAVLLRPLPYDDADRLVMLWETFPARGELESFVSYPNYRDWRDRAESFVDLSAFWSFGNGDVNLTGGLEPERVPVARVMAGYFETLGVPPLHGRTIRPEENVVGNHRVAMLSYGLWQRQFGGDPRIVGQDVQINGFPYEVVGIMPSTFRPLGTLALGDEVALWRPLAPDDDQTGGRAARNLRVVGRLAPGVSLRQAQAELDAIAAGLADDYPESNEGAGVRLATLRTQVVGDVRPALMLLWTAVSLVLLIACANVANLFLVRAASAKKQFAIQRALGAPRRALIAQLLTETLLLGSAGGVAGLVLAFAGVRVLVALGPADVPLLGDVRIDLPVLGFTAMIVGVTSLAFGMVPALRSSNPDLAGHLREGGRWSGASTDRWLAAALVVSEVALATVLLATSGLLLRSFQELSRVDPGLDPEGVLTLQLELPMGTTYPRQADRDQFFDRLLERIRQFPDVVTSSMASGAPIEDVSSEIAFTIPGVAEDPSDPLLRANVRMVDSAYFESLKIPVLTGRPFTPEDHRDAPRVVVVSRALADAVWRGSDPVGTQVRLPFGNATAEVVGVVGDVRTEGLDVGIPRTMYWHAPQWGFNFMTVIVRTASQPLAAFPDIRAAIREMDSNLPVYNVRTMEELVAVSVAQQRFEMFLVGIFAALATSLAMVGVYGVVAYAVSSRTEEFGLRSALGAQAGDTMVMILRQGAVPVVTGIAIGMAITFGLSGVLQAFLFGVGPADPVAMLAAPLLLGLTAAIATLIPARRATKVDPIVSLRAE